MLWQHLTTMVIDKIHKMSIKGVKLKSESFFSISPGVLELWRKNLRGADSTPPPRPDRVNPITCRILTFRQLRGGLFGPDPENKVTVNSDLKFGTNNGMDDTSKLAKLFN